MKSNRSHDNDTISWEEMTDSEKLFEAHYRSRQVSPGFLAVMLLVALIVFIVMYGAASRKVPVSTRTKATVTHI